MGSSTSQVSELQHPMSLFYSAVWFHRCDWIRYDYSLLLSYYIDL